MAEKEEHNEFHEKVIDDLATQRQMLKDILTQTTKTNGRVTRLEDKVQKHDEIHAVEIFGKRRSDWWKDKLGTAAIGIICAALGFTALLVLQKTDIVNVSTVTPEIFDSLPE